MRTKSTIRLLCSHIRGQLQDSVPSKVEPGRASNCSPTRQLDFNVALTTGPHLAGKCLIATQGTEKTSPQSHLQANTRSQTLFCHVKTKSMQESQL